MKSRISFFIVIFCISVVNVFSTPKDNFIQFMLNEYDLDKDNKISKDDIKIYTIKSFELMDSNKNQKVDINEFYKVVCDNSCRAGECDCKNSKSIIIENYFHSIALTNKDYISLDDYIKSNLNTIINFDINNDDFITKDELEKTVGRYKEE